MSAAEIVTIIAALSAMATAIIGALKANSAKNAAQENKQLSEDIKFNTNGQTSRLHRKIESQERLIAKLVDTLEPGEYEKILDNIKIEDAVKGGRRVEDRPE